MLNNFPECKTPEDCYFYVSGGVITTTCMAFPPVYDHDGNNINPDRNTQAGQVNCSTCMCKFRIHKLVCETEWKWDLLYAGE